MIRTVRLVLFAAALVSVCGTPAMPQTSQMLSTPPHFDLSTLRCHDLLDASLTNRGYAMMLFWGFEAGKAGKTAFVTSRIREKSRKLVDFCANNPQMLIFTAIKRIGGLAVAETPHSPVRVNKCDPRLNYSMMTTDYFGYVPGYYPMRGPYYWPDLYGRLYYQPPIQTTIRTDSTLSIDYVNAGDRPMKTIEFGLVAKGRLVAEARDVGTFTPGAEIKHQFGLDPNVFPLGTAFSECVPLHVTYADGTVWTNPRLPALRQSVHGEPQRSRHDAQ